MQGFRAFERIFDFSGRSGRAEYWQFIAILAVVLVVAAIVDVALGLEGPLAATRLASYGFMIPHIAVATRRLHDRGRSGWWIVAYAAFATTGIAALIMTEMAVTATAYEGARALFFVNMVVLLGLAIFLLVQFVLPGDELRNQYGAPDGDGARSTASETRQPHYPGPQPARAEAPVLVTPAIPAEDPLDRIQKLAQLRDAGVITDEEFAAQKATLLKRL